MTSVHFSFHAEHSALSSQHVFSSLSYEPRQCCRCRSDKRIQFLSIGFLILFGYTSTCTRRATDHLLFSPQHRRLLWQKWLSSVSTLCMCRKIAGVGTCTFDELVRRLPTYSWAPVFSAVDHLQPARTPLGQMHARRRLCGYSSHRAAFSHSRVIARPGVPGCPISGDPIRRRAMNRDMA